MNAEQKTKAIAAHDGALTESFAIHSVLDGMWDEATGALEAINPQDIADMIAASRRLTDHLQTLAVQTARITA